MSIHENITSGEKLNTSSNSGNIITVNFRQDTLFAVERDDGVFVAVKPICDSLGLAWAKQLERIKRDPILAEGVTIMVIPSPGGAQETTCLKLELVNGWLFTIDESRVKDEEIRQRVLTYKRECYKVLFDAFYGKKATPKDPVPATEETSDNENLKLRHITECRQTFGTAAASQLWFRLGLPVVPAMLQDPRQMTIFDYQQIKAQGGTA